MRGGAGNDEIEGGQGADRIDGGAGDDELEGGDVADWIDGGDGDDELDGGRGDDVLIGGKGDDRVKDGKGDDLLVRGPGCDRLDGGPGNNRTIDYADFTAAGMRRQPGLRRRSTGARSPSSGGCPTHRTVASRGSRAGSPTSSARSARA